MAAKGNKNAVGNKGGRPTLYRQEMCSLVIEYGKEGDSITSIAVRLGVRKSTLYEWCSVHPEFSDAIRESQEFAQQVWEGELRKAATGINKDANATLMIFTMKNRFREDWRDKIDQEVTGPNGGPQQHEHKVDLTISPEDAYKQLIGKR